MGAPGVSPPLRLLGGLLRGFQLGGLPRIPAYGLSEVGRRERTNDSEDRS